MCLVSAQLEKYQQIISIKINNLIQEVDQKNERRYYKRNHIV